MRKIKETRDAQNAAFESQTITIDNHWRIIRSDNLNWEVQFKGQFWGYYGTVAKAFQALPGKMLSEEARGTVADVRGTLNDIIYRIEKAMKISSSPDVKPDGPRPESKQTECQTNEAAPMSGYAVPSRAAGGEDQKI